MMRARLHLEFSAVDGGTQFRCLQQEPPWKVVRAFPNPSGESLVHLNNVSGGVFGGDHMSLRIDVGPDAQAQITSTGSTRVYRPRAHAADAMLATEIHLGRDALLEYLPDSVIPFREARFEQCTDVHLAPGATLFWWEIIAPGRVASGELFAYESLRVRASISNQERPIFIDRMSIQPREAKLSSLARFGKYRYLTSFMICRTNEDATIWIALERMLREIAQQRSGSDTYWGATALTSDGLLVRGLSISPVAIMEDLFCFWTSAKNYLCGRAATAPRRTY
jgi:urease accessory protein